MSLSKYKQPVAVPTSVRRNSHPLRLCSAFVVCLLGLGACQSASKGDPELKKQTREMFPESQATPVDEDGEPPSQVGSKWTIKLLMLKGSAQESAIQTVLRSVKATGVPEAFAETRGEHALIAVGKYDSPTSPDAQAMLKRVKELQIDGQRPYMAAHMLPPPAQSLKGTVPEWDLRNAKAKYGKQAEFTLQVNIYTNPNGRASVSEVREFQRAAEDAVRTLRKEHAEAFYYHDQAGSTVTVGLFSQDELDSGFSLKPGAGSGIRELQKRFPYAMLNGAGVKERSVDAQGKPVESMRPSFIVRVPD